MSGPASTKQHLASDPTASAWVSANAGSGKTYVLTQRVKRLLLSGVEPGRILCLTFTKAAAANMANRILQDLAGWSTMPDADLAKDLAQLNDVPQARITRADLARARRVFAAALETPGGLKIQTIHAFCDALLHQFPFEAGVAAGFTVLDDAGAGDLRLGARAHAIAQAVADAHGPLGRALRLLAVRMAENGFADLIDALADEREAVARMLPTLADAPALAARLRALLDVPDGLTRAELDRRMLAEARLDIARFTEAADLLETHGSPKDKDCAQRLRAVVRAANTDDVLAAYEAVFRTTEGSFRRGAFCTKQIVKLAPWLDEGLQADLARLAEVDRLRNALTIAETTHALVVMARAVIERMDLIKAERGLLDFADLVTCTNRLLQGERAQWVRWKLDRGIEHLLVDEAQDTSEAQWAVVRALTEEFFAGEGASRAVRTLFAVGDEKQSIFSFQGAEPARFAGERDRVAQRAQGAAHTFHKVELTVSYRSVEAVLAAVDCIFEKPPAQAGLMAGGGAVPPHETSRRGLPGHVELWPVEPKPVAPDPDAWAHPFDAVGADAPSARLAARIARTIKDGIGRVAVHDKDGTPRPLRAGDVMILVRRRNALFEEMIRALKADGVPVAGADRLVLSNHIAVMDLLALGDAVLLPEDDLTLATLMKSPLMGLGEADLYDLAHHRRGGALMAAFAARAAERPAWQAAYDAFQAWRDRADVLRPYEFFARILGPDGGRRAFMARLGREANDALDEFLERALAYERTATPTLRGFLTHVRLSDVDVKREMEQGRDEVRVMTVHNAKGLEAKMVILPDTTGLPGAGRAEVLHEVEDDGGESLILWSPSKRLDVGPVAAARARAEQAQMDEYRRLLYVALTRAEERLIVCGLPDGRRNAPADESWYALVETALSPEAEEQRDALGNLVAKVWRRSDAVPGALTVASAEPAAPLPDWVRAAPVPPPPATPMLAPSRAADGDERRRTPGGGDSGIDARLRGDTLHRILQTLPDVPPERRFEAARRFAERRIAGAGGAIAAEAVALLNDAAFAPFLAGLAEVPITGEVTLGDGRVVRVAGRIDRLAVTDSEVAFVDFKTGEAPPPGDMPEAYLAQMALYEAVLARLWPGRVIGAHILWTRVPRVDRLDRVALDAALSRVKAPIPRM